MRKYHLILPLSVFLLVGCKQEELLKGLDQSQVNEVIALLQRNNIESTKQEVAKEGFKVTVDPKDFSAAVDLMNTYGLPRPANMEIASMFPSDSLVSSPRAEKARLYSGIEQRLAQSLLLIQGVVASRVHVSYDLSAGEGDRKKTQIHISSLVNYDNNLIDTQLLVGDIKRFLKNSFEDVQYDNISVILSPVPDVQREAPIPTLKHSPSIISWLFIIGALLIAAMATMLLFLRKSNHPLANKIKEKSPLKKPLNVFRDKAAEKVDKEESKPDTFGSKDAGSSLPKEGDGELHAK